MLMTPGYTDPRVYIVAALHEAETCYQQLDCPTLTRESRTKVPLSSPDRREHVLWLPLLVD